MDCRCSTHLDVHSRCLGVAACSSISWRSSFWCVSSQGRVTDHRVGHTEHGIDRVLAGESLDVFIDALQAQYMNERLLSLGSE